MLYSGDVQSAHKLMRKIDQFWRGAVHGTNSSVAALEGLMANLRPAFRVPIFGSAQLSQEKHTEYWKFVHLLSFWLAYHGIDVVTGYGPGVMEAATLGAQAGARARAQYGDEGDHTPIVIGVPLLGFPQEPTQVGADIELPSTVFGLRLMAFRLLGTAAIAVWGGYGADLENKDWLQHSQQIERLLKAASDREQKCSDILSKNASVLLGWKPPLIYADVRWLPSVLQAEMMRWSGTITPRDTDLYLFPYSDAERQSFLSDVVLKDSLPSEKSAHDLLGWFPPTTNAEQEVERILQIILDVREQHSEFLLSKGVEPTLPRQQPDRSCVQDSDFGL